MDGDLQAWVGPLIQLATAGGFGTLAWYLVVKHIPSIEARHAAERKEAREAFLESLDKLEKRLESIVGDFRDSLKQFTSDSAGVQQELGAFRTELARLAAQRGGAQ